MNIDKKMLVPGLVGVIIGIILMLVVTFPQGNTFGYKNFMMGSANNGSQRYNMMRSIDSHFIEQMIPHHQGAIEMAQLALVKSKRQEIKTLANAIIESQSKEIVDMTGWYRRWFGKEVPDVNIGMMGGGMMSESGMHMGGPEEVRSLEVATDFDKAFLEAMIPHHQLALMMVQMLEVGSSRPEMLQLAKNITESQSKEIQTMQGWYNEWYAR